jgi:hypothetical protein
MAIRHGLSGQFGKREATQRHRRMLIAIFTAGILGTGGVGWVSGYFWSRWGPIVASIAVCALFAMFILAWRRIERYLDKTALERLRYLRGGQAEGLVAWILEDLDDDWHIFNSIKLEKDSDIDHVVIGPGGVFCISTKSQRGVFCGTRDGLLHNDQPSPFARDALRQTMDLVDWFKQAMRSNIPYVQGVLAVPLGFTKADACDGKVWLVHQENLISRLAPKKAQRKLDQQQITRTVKVLEMIEQNAASVFQRAPVNTPPDPIRQNAS